MVRISTPALRLALPKPKVMTPTENLRLLEEAVGRRPERVEARLQLAQLLLEADRFGESLQVLEGVEPPRELAFQCWVGRGLSHLARETPEDDLAAHAAFDRACEHGATDRALATALAHLGKTHVRLGQVEQAREVLTRALARDRRSVDALKRLTAIDLRAGRDREALERCETLVEAGVGHSRLLGDRFLALSALGQEGAASELLGLDRWLTSTEPLPPRGWATLAAFNAALAEELADHPGLRFERYGVASISSWRIDDPLLARSRVVPAMVELLAREIAAHAGRLGERNDREPFLRARPDAATLRMWAVLSNGPGFESWHLHPGGWLSGVYYVAVPDTVALGSDRGGCLELGSPELEHIPRPFPGPRRLIRPRAGRLLMFPSHTFHRTHPSAAPERRLSVAFDVIPHAA